MSFSILLGSFMFGTCLNLIDNMLDLLSIPELNDEILCLDMLAGEGSSFFLPYN